MAPDREDALAQFSEGWCPICETPFADGGDGRGFRCGSGGTRVLVRREIDQVWPPKMPERATGF